MTRSGRFLFMLAALGAAMTSMAAARAADANGSWKWTFERGERSVEVKLDLQCEGEKLTGKVYSSDRETKIVDGRFKNDEVSFKTIRERAGNKFVMTYKGKVIGDKIEGSIQFEAGERSASRPWEATRVTGK